MQRVLRLRIDFFTSNYVRILYGDVWFVTELRKICRKVSYPPNMKYTLMRASFMDSTLTKILHQVEI